MEETDSMIRRAEPSDHNELAKMRALLWPDASSEEHRNDLARLLNNGVNLALPTVIFVACDKRGTLTGFIEVGLRSHADGCDPICPVGFVEGWFVHEPFRNRGVGRELMSAAENWARSQGCIEMASEALIDNMASHHAHEALGFQVVDRCVHFRKILSPGASLKP